MNRRYSLFFNIIFTVSIVAAPKQQKMRLVLDGGYFIQHKPEELTTELGVFYKSLEVWHQQLSGKKITQSEYDWQLLTLFITALENGYHDELVTQIRKIYNKGALEQFLEEKTDVEEAFVQMIGDVEYELLEKIRELIRKRLEMRITQLSESELGEKLEEFKDKIDNLPPFIKDKIESLILKFLENSQHLPDNIKEKIKEYAEYHAQEHQHTYWEIATSLSDYMIIQPLSSVSSYFTSFWQGQEDKQHA